MMDYAHGAVGWVTRVINSRKCLKYRCNRIYSKYTTIINIIISGLFKKKNSSGSYHKG